MASLGSLGASIVANAQGFLTEITKSEKAVSQFEKSITKSVTQAGTSIVGLTAIANAVRKEFLYVYQNVEKIKGIDPQVVADINVMREAMKEAKLEVDRMTAASIGLFATASKSIGLFAGGVRESMNSLRLSDFSNIWSLGAAIKRQYSEATRVVTETLDAEYQAANKAAQAQNSLAAATLRTNAIKEQQSEIMKRVNEVLGVFFDDLDKKSTSTFAGVLANLKESLKVTESMSAEVKGMATIAMPKLESPTDSFLRRGLSASISPSTAGLTKQVELLRDQLRVLNSIDRGVNTAQVAAFA